MCPLFSLKLIRWEYGITEGTKDVIGSLALKEPCRPKSTYRRTETTVTISTILLTDGFGDMWGFLMVA
jgi:hypothetical protein